MCLKDFLSTEKPLVQLSPDAVLNVPHLDSAGVLCVQGDPGPGLGYTPEERILFLLHAYLEQFLKPWLNGDLDGDFFETEALNYWAIEAAEHARIRIRCEQFGQSTLPDEGRTQEWTALNSKPDHHRCR